MLICFGEVEQAQEQGSFSEAKVSHRLAIVAAGAIVNIVFGVIVYFLLMAISGINSSTVIKQMVPEYVTESTVLESGDQILMINGEKTRIKSDIDNILYKSDGENLEILVNRNGQEIILNVKPMELQIGEVTRYILGVEVEQAEANLQNNLYYGFWETVGFLESTADGIIKLFTGKLGLDKMTGPVGISGMVANTNGVYDFVYLLAVISLSLGVTNLLPIPALDGGKIVLLIIEGISKKKIDEELELKIQSIGFSLLILLALYVSVNDVIKLF